MERGFLNAYTFDAPPRGGDPPPKRPRSARGTGENVEEEIQPTADEEIRPTQAGPSQTTADVIAMRPRRRGEDV